MARKHEANESERGWGETRPWHPLDIKLRAWEFRIWERPEYREAIWERRDEFGTWQSWDQSEALAWIDQQIAETASKLNSRD